MLLPRRALRQGVDGSILFGLPVLPRHGPSFHYLNQIPGVLAVQGYVDDTAIAGDGQDLAWIGKVESCYGAGSEVPPSEAPFKGA